jgi:hypothetical protein
MNFWEAANNVARIENTHGCLDQNGKTVAGGFASAAAIPSTRHVWSGGHSFRAGSFLSDIPSQSIVGAVGSSDSGGTTFVTYQYWSNSQNNFGTWVSGTGCGFDTTHTHTSNSTPDFAFFPAAGVYGYQLNPAANP